MKIELIHAERVYWVEAEVPEGKLEAAIVEYNTKVKGEDFDGRYVAKVKLNGKEDESLAELAQKLFEENR